MYGPSAGMYIEFSSLPFWLSSRCTTTTTTTSIRQVLGEKKQKLRKKKTKQKQQQSIRRRFLLYWHSATRERKELEGIALLHRKIWQLASHSANIFGEQRWHFYYIKTLRVDFLEQFLELYYLSSSSHLFLLIFHLGWEPKMPCANSQLKR